MSDETHNTPNKATSRTATPIISRVSGDTIVELLYDRERRETALAVSRFGGLWNIEREITLAGENCIPYSATNNLIQNECVLLPLTAEHHGDKAELLGEIERYIRRYVNLSPVFERIAAHYVLLSWVYDAFNELPYLRLKGDFGTGKTRGLIAIGSVMYKPFFSSGASTVSPIFHILDVFGGSLILDEADFRFTDATNDLVKILNGTTRGLPVLRTMQNRHRELDPRAFRVFGPKLVAMRSVFADRGLESRFISEDMTGRGLRDDIPIHLPDALRSDALGLRNRLLHYRFCALFSTRVDPELASREDDPRVSQMILPLLSVIDDPELRKQVRELALIQAAEISREDRGKRLRTAVARAVAHVFVGSDEKFVSVGVIAERVNGILGAYHTNKMIGTVLREHLGIETFKSNGIYVVARAALDHARTRSTNDEIKESKSLEDTNQPAA